MNITAEQQTARVPVTILRLQGDLDGSNYLDLVAAAKTAQQNNAKYLLLDLTGVPYMSSAGLVALHSAVQLLRGEQPPDPEAGWSTALGKTAQSAAARDAHAGDERHECLLRYLCGRSRGAGFVLEHRPRTGPAAGFDSAAGDL